jgi:hypothetical protein
MVCVLASKLDIRACCAPPRFRFKELRIEKVEEKDRTFLYIHNFRSSLPQGMQASRARLCGRKKTVGTRQQQEKGQSRNTKPNPTGEPMDSIRKNLPALLLQSLPTTKRKLVVEGDFFIYEIRTLLQGAQKKC